MDKSKDNRKTITSNLLWRFSERIFAQLIAFIVYVILARIIDPSIHGKVALITVFTIFLQVFVDSGLGNALIQKKDADDLDFSTVFYTNIAFCSVLYIVVYFFSPLIAKYFNDLSMVPYIRVLSLTILISGVKNVQQAYVSKNMMFRKFFFSTLGGTVVAGVIGITMAINGAGIWSLVTQQIINLLIDTLILWITVKWRPILAFSFKRLKGLYSFGWKILLSSLIDTAYREIRQLIIGKIYSSTDLAYYNQGERMPDLIVNNIDLSIDSVLLPTLSNEQDNLEKVKNMTRRAIKTSVYIMAPLMMGLFFVGEPLIRLFLTDKWLPTLPYLRVFCVIYMFYPIHTANLNAIKAVGRSDIFLKLEIAKKIIGLVAVILTMNISVMAMAYSLLFVSVLNQIINSWPNRKILHYGYLEQLKDIIPSILLAFFMGICVSFFNRFALPEIIVLFIQVLLGAIIYIFGSILFRIDSFEYILNIAKNYLKS